MKKVKKINEMYFNACGCSSFDGNEDYGFKKDEDYDNGYNTPRYSNASGDVETLDIDDEEVISSDITAQRLDNSLPHYINNIIPMCINCNCSNK